MYFNLPSIDSVELFRSGRKQLSISALHTFDRYYSRALYRVGTAQRYTSQNWLNNILLNSRRCKYLSSFNYFIFDTIDVVKFLTLAKPRFHAPDHESSTTTHLCQSMKVLQLSYWSQTNLALSSKNTPASDSKLLYNARTYCLWVVLNISDNIENLRLTSNVKKFLL